MYIRLARLPCSLPIGTAESLSGTIGPPNGAIIFKYGARESMPMETEAGIVAREFPYLDRYVQIGIAQGRVISVSFPSRPEPDATPEHALLDRIAAYLEGDHEDFDDVTVALTVPTDQRSVLEAVRDIPYGEDASVAQVVRMTPGLDPDDEADADLVREALAANPAPIFIPDHRVRDGPSAAPPDIEQKLRAVEGL